MKVMIDGYEVNIKARYVGEGQFGEVPFNDHDTMACLNYISLCFSKASEQFSKEGCATWGRRTKRSGKDIFDVLYKEGYYDYEPMGVKE